MRRFPGKLPELIENSGLNLNTISKASGISNTYLAKLVRGGINRPGKDKIASVMLALNLTISDTNDMLAEYDYQPLHTRDIPDLLENNRRRRIEGGNLLQYDHIYLEMFLVALERVGGTKILVKDRPSGVFMPDELYLMKEFPFESDDEAASFRYDLTAALLKERIIAFKANIEAGHRVETFICRSCLDDYLETHLSEKAQKEHPRRTTLVIRYFANALYLSHWRPELHAMHIMDRCPHFQFQMQDADGDSPKVSYPGRKMHVFNNEHDNQSLEGFTTDLPQIVYHFRQEIDRCRAAVDPAISADQPRGVTDYFLSRFHDYGVGEKLEESLSDLLANPNLDFY